MLWVSFSLGDHAEPFTSSSDARNSFFPSDRTSHLVPVYMQLRKLNYKQQHVLLPNTRGRYKSFQRVIFPVKL